MIERPETKGNPYSGENIILGRALLVADFPKTSPHYLEKNTKAF
jgi:hypothetical protein|tara:strand:- start:4895 stop:5026 length:132 start_codon:yes stop_codon:yes gene_type:complete